MGLFSLWTLVAHSSLLRWLLLLPVPPPTAQFNCSQIWELCVAGHEGREGLHPLAAVTVAHHAPLLPVLLFMSLPLLGY